MADASELYQQAEQLKDEGKLEEAIAKLSELLADDDAHALSHLALAVLYGKVGEHEKAIEHGKRVIEIEPEDPFNYTALSVTYQRAWQGTQNQQYIQLAEDAMARSHGMQGQ